MNMEPLDSAGPGAGSRERLDRLRAPVVQPIARAERSVLPWVISAVLLAFALGLIANPWFEHSVRSQLPGLGTVPATGALPVSETGAAGARPPAAAPAAAAARNRPSSAISSAAAQSTDATGASGSTSVIAQRPTRLDSQLDTAGRDSSAVDVRLDQLTAAVATLSSRLDVMAQAQQAVVVTGTVAADRAQAMLAVLAAHHAIDGGARLGPLELPLRHQLAASYPAAVEAVAALGAEPVTLAGLRRDFDRLRPQLIEEPAPASDWRSSLSVALATIVRVRPAPRTSVIAASLEAAAAALRAGDVAGARDRLASLPSPARARGALWLAAADRYIAGTRGLAALDAAMLAPVR